MALTRVKKILQIDSVDRDATKYPTNGDYVVYLPRIYKNVTSIRLLGAEFPPVSTLFINNNNSVGFSSNSYTITPSVSTSTISNAALKSGIIAFNPNNILGTDNVIVGFQTSSGAVLGARFTNLGWQTVTTTPNPVLSSMQYMQDMSLDSTGAIYAINGADYSIYKNTGYGSTNTSVVNDNLFNPYSPRFDIYNNLYNTLSPVNTNGIKVKYAGTTNDAPSIAAILPTSGSGTMANGVRYDVVNNAVPISPTVAPGDGLAALGNARFSRLTNPQILDSNGNLYILDTNFTIRMIYNKGTALPAYYGVSTTLTWSTGTTMSGALTNGTIVYTVAASGGLTVNTSYIVINADGTTYNLALLLTPTTAVTLTSNPTVYVQTLQGMPGRGNVYIVGGCYGANAGNMVNNGPAISSTINPVGITVDSNGNLYFSDGGQIRMIYNQGTALPAYYGVSTVLTYSGSGGQNLITTLLANGTIVYTVAASGGLTANTSYIVLGNDASKFNLALLSSPTVVITTLTSSPTVFVQTLQSTPVRGNVYTVAGNLTTPYNGDNISSLGAGMLPYRLKIDADNNLYFSDRSNSRIRMIYKSGSTVDGYYPGASLAITDIVSNGTYATVTVSSNATFTPNTIVVIANIGTSTAFNGTYAVYTQISSTQFTYLTTTLKTTATYGGATATPINSLTSSNMVSGNIYTIAGNGQQDVTTVSIGTGDGQLGCFAKLYNPMDIDVDSSKNVYFVDKNNGSANGLIRKIASLTQVIPFTSFYTGSSYSNGILTFATAMPGGYNLGSNTNVVSYPTTVSCSSPTFPTGTNTSWIQVGIQETVSTSPGPAYYLFTFLKSGTYSWGSGNGTGGGSGSGLLWTSGDKFQIINNGSNVTFYKNSVLLGTATYANSNSQNCRLFVNVGDTGSPGNTTTASIPITYYKQGIIPTAISSGNVVISGTNAQYTATNPDTNGFIVGGDIGISGYSNSVNNGIFTINAVTSTYIQVATTTQVAQTGTGTITPINSSCNINTILAGSYTYPKLTSSLLTYNSGDLFKLSISSTNTLAVTQNTTINNTTQIVNIPTSLNFYASGTILNSYTNKIMIANTIPTNVPSNTYYFLTELEGLNKSDETRVGGDKSAFIDKYFAKIPAVTNKYGNIAYSDKNLPENIAKYSPPIEELDRLHIRTRLHSQQDNSGFVYSLNDHDMTFEIEYIDNVANMEEK